jgi:uncharacterized Zn finger protein (UPF0148 family)
MSAYVKLDKAPMFVLHHPTCSACGIDLEHDGDTFTCPNCGTSWDPNANDGDEGQLYPSWSGEEVDGPVLTHDQALKVATYRERAERHKRYPDLFPTPVRPGGLPAGVIL